MSAAGGLAATPIPGHRATKLPGRKPCAVVLADRSIQDVSGNLTSPVSATYLTTRPVAAAHPHKVPAQRQQAVPSGRRPSVSRGDDYRPRKSALTDSRAGARPPGWCPAGATAAGAEPRLAQESGVPITAGRAYLIRLRRGALPGGRE